MPQRHCHVLSYCFFSCFFSSLLFGDECLCFGIWARQRRINRQTYKQMRGKAIEDEEYVESMTQHRLWVVDMYETFIWLLCVVFRRRRRRCRYSSHLSTIERGSWERRDVGWHEEGNLNFWHANHAPRSSIDNPKWCDAALFSHCSAICYDMCVFYVYFFFPHFGAKHFSYVQCVSVSVCATNSNMEMSLLLNDTHNDCTASSI